MTDNERKKKVLELKELVQQLSDRLSEACTENQEKDRQIGLLTAENFDLREELRKMQDEKTVLAYEKLQATKECAELRTALEVEVGISSQYRQKAYAYDRMMADRVADTIGV